ncbi:proteasome assembly chaperone 2 [Aplysia californica]|uniref:Proteasome assembly chaperone 2 n=1 Tax=Aplysia californica TaxID=6500 RepID=A0ABM0K7W2_APLCA|nr:proteasome assembly chaperone 2 [Aplysia californica]
MYIAATKRKHDWQDFTLILPTVSVGNVGQLAADLIISTLWMERVGYIHHPSLLPVAGNNPFAHEDATSCKLATCCEVYESISAQVVVIQQRAPFIKGKRKEFADWLSKWVKDKHFYRVIILTSTFAQERLDYQMTGSPFRILQSPSMEEQSGEFFRTKMGWKELERRHSFPAPTPQQVAAEETGHQLLYMPGSGIAKTLYENCQEQPLLVFMMFVSEGDNAQDALAVADQLNAWLSLIEKKDKQSKDLESQNFAKGIVEWKVPMSWRLVFGSRFDQKLFQ